MEKDIVIFNGRIAKQLIRTKKFELVDISNDKNNRDKTVFFFENTEELKEYLKSNFNIIIK